MLQNILTVSPLLIIALEHDILIEEDLLDLGLPWWLSGQKYACQFRRHSVISGLGRSPEKEMTTHSSLLTWETAWTEEPGGPQSRGLQSQTRFSMHSHSISFKCSLPFPAFGLLPTSMPFSLSLC